MSYAFNPLEKLIILDTTFVDVKDLYSRWKDWAIQGDNSKYLPAFRVLGGDPIGSDLFVSIYLFLTNGWRIRPKEANHTLVIKGNISVEEGGDPVVSTLGTYRVLVQYTVPERAQAIATSGSSITVSEIVSAIRDDLSGELAKINSLTFTTPNKVDASAECSGSGGGGIFYWNGTSWVPPA